DANQAIAEDLLYKGEIDLAITELGAKPRLSIQSCSLINLPLVLIIPKLAPIRTIRDLFDGRAPLMSLISLPPEEVITKHFHQGEGFVAFAVEVEEDAPFGVGFVQGFAKCLHIGDRFTVDFGDDILALDILLRGQAVFTHVRDNDALLHAKMQTLRHLLGQI